MSSITLIFPENWDEQQIVRALAQKESGFDRDRKAPLESNLDTGIAMVGVLINAAQLALTIVLLQKQAAPPSPGGRDIYVRGRDGSRRLLPTEDTEKLVAALEKLVDDQ